jgi:hypothetical protein
MADPIFTALLAFISATIMAVLGYLKNQPEEAFKPEKLFSTYLAALIVAIAYVLWNVDPGTGELLVFYFFQQSGLTVILERIFKFLWRKWIAPNIPDGD